MPLMRHADLFGSNSNIHLSANQAAGNRIGVGSHLNRAAATDANAGQKVVGVESLLRQRLERRLFFEEPLRTIGVGATDQLFHEVHVLLAAGELPAAAQQQRLVDALLDVPVGRFDIAVLVGAPRIGAFRFAAVMSHQRRVAIRQQLAAGVIADRRAERIGSMPLRHSSEFPKRFLDALAECFKRF